VISVVVYASDDQATIAWCLESLSQQQAAGEFEVVVLDDGSSDRTAATVAERFPQYRLVHHGQRAGWVRSLRQQLPELRGEWVALLGAHCRAYPDWLACIQKEASLGHGVVVGSGQHGDHGFLQRFQALSVHGDYLGQVAGEVEQLWDDNMAIQHGLLRQALPATDVVLSDGAGAVLLSRALHKQGAPIVYRPCIRVLHSTHSMVGMVRMWFGEMAANSIAMKLADRSSPGAGLLRLGPVAAGAFAAKRWLQGLAAMPRARTALSMSIPELAIHVLLFSLLMPVYFLGLCKELLTHRREIWGVPA
jgi:hypothetical protein